MEGDSYEYLTSGSGSDLQPSGFDTADVVQVRAPLTKIVGAHILCYWRPDLVGIYHIMEAICRYCYFVMYITVAEGHVVFNLVGHQNETEDTTYYIIASKEQAFTSRKIREDSFTFPNTFSKMDGEFHSTFLFTAARLGVPGSCPVYILHPPSARRRNSYASAGN